MNSEYSLIEFFWQWFVQSGSPDAYVKYSRFARLCER